MHPKDKDDEHDEEEGRKKNRRWKIEEMGIEGKAINADVYLPVSLAPISQQEYKSWLLEIPRGAIVDMYKLTEANDCKRLPSWRSNEKRYIRLQKDREKAKDCEKTYGVKHSQLLGLRARKDHLPLSHEQYLHYEHPADKLPKDDPPLWRLVEKYANAQGGGVIDRNEKLRLFSIASIAASPLFLWNDVSHLSPYRQRRLFYSVDELIEAKRLVRDSDGVLVINAEALEECGFSRRKSLSHVDLDPFSLQGYRWVQFLFEEAFLRYGWVTIPTAGTALGTLRHHGMFRGDDDMDMMIYPPNQYLYEDTPFSVVYDQFNEIVERYGAKHPHDFTWFRSNDYRKVGEKPWYTKKDLDKKLPPWPLSEYNWHIRQETRVCHAQYMTWNTSEKRRLFQNEMCVPNHHFVCLQPPQYLYEPHDEILERHLIHDTKQYTFTENITELAPLLFDLPSIYTAFHRRPMGKICRAKFGVRKQEFDRFGKEVVSYGLAMDNLHDFVLYWYDNKWCVPSGGVRTRKWSFLKSWND